MFRFDPHGKKKYGAKFVVQKINQNPPDFINQSGEYLHLMTLSEPTLEGTFSASKTPRFTLLATSQ
jgi:hypothetical protein